MQNCGAPALATLFHDPVQEIIRTCRLTIANMHKTVEDPTAIIPVIILTRLFIQLSMRTNIESLTYTRALPEDEGTYGLAATICLDMPALQKIGRNLVPMNMLLLGELHYKPRGHFAHRCCLCRS